MGIENFYLAGINYKKTDAAIRGEFAVNNEQYSAILNRASEFGLEELFVVSTCNRTEIYGFADKMELLTGLLCSETAGKIEDFEKIAYKKQGLDAIDHLFSVAAGLDSQILGDYEIIGQIKAAVKFAKERGFVKTVTDRLVNFVLQASRAIKNQTCLSEGTVSVSFAAIQYLKETVKDIHTRKIVLIGTGKIGNNTCKNLVDYLQTKNIVLINRDGEKARVLASELQLQTAAFSDLSAELDTADIVIVATNAEKPVVTKNDVKGNRILIDLSIPNNIDPAAKEIPGVQLVNVDDLSKLNDLTLQKRQAEVPKARKIIEQYTDDFIEWLHLRKNVPFFKEVKKKLMDLQHTSTGSLHPNFGFDKELYSADIQKVINTMAVRMRHHHRPGCHYIEAINEFINSRNK